MTFGEWEKTIPQSITDDALWRMKVYQMALFAADTSWQDVTKLMGDKRTFALSDQLYRAIGSVSANIAEGYSRGSGKDRSRFYEYALGSAREARDWYFKARHVLAIPVSEQRMDYLSQIIRYLLTILPDQRTVYLKEDTGTYETIEAIPETPPSTIP